uniref:Uncharacterized protein LOC111120412 n=1 Tax=Crassostrea virginica TaxID=6565 RepID=A0A8B8CM30_CRAVI|nr:uncharacterized protein LOC111120412 [Crassostrea virginica]
MAIDCNNKRIRPLQCSITSDCHCSRPGFNGTSAVSRNWIQCLNICTNDGRYLSGDYDVLETESVCTALGTTSGQTWIGMAKSVFILDYIGHPYSLLLQCWYCKGHTCEFTSCSEEKFAICEQHHRETTTLPRTTTMTLSTTVHSTTTEPMHHTSNNSSTTSPISIPNPENNQDILRDTLLAAGGSLIIVSIITAILITYLRKRCRKTTADECSPMGPAADLPKQLVSGDYPNLHSMTKSETGEHVYYNSQRQACQLQNGTQFNPTKSKGQYESCENSEEGQTYDRLWQTSPSSSTADDRRHI